MLDSDIAKIKELVYKNLDLHNGTPYLPIFALKNILEGEIFSLNSKIDRLSSEEKPIDEIGKLFISYQKTKKILKDVIKTLDKLI